MTALIAILNKNAVALAADSAVTSTKIHNSANKLFTLSKYEPVAIMAYGMSEYMGIPWETVIKMYRSQLGQASFTHLQEYADDFLRYISGQELIVPAIRQAAVLEQIIRSVLYELRGAVVKAVEERLAAQNPLPDEEVPAFVTEVITNHASALLGAPLLNNVDQDFETAFVREHSEQIRHLAGEIFQELPIGAAIEEIVRICCYRFTRDFWLTHSGLVFAGFGRQDVLPVVKACKVECVFAGRLRHRWDEELGCDMNENQGRASIIPYAQFDVVHRFIKGIDGQYRDQYATHLRTLLTETYPEKLLEASNIVDEGERRDAKAELIRFGRTAVQEFNDAWAAFEQNVFVQPVINVVAESVVSQR